MEFVIRNATVVNTPADKKPVAVVIMHIVIFNGGKRRAGAGMQSCIAAAGNLAVLNRHIFSDLPTDSLAVKIFYMNIVNSDFFRLQNQYPCIVATIGKKVFCTIPVNSKVINNRVSHPDYINHRRSV